MKSFLLLLSLVFASQAFAQSMISLKNGKVLTIDDQGMLQDLGNFFLPYEIKTFGGRYLVDDKRKVHTIDSSGFMYSKKDEDKVAQNIEVTGDNYFTSKWGKLYTLDETGVFFENKKDKLFRKIKHKGGIFFISETKRVSALYAVTNLGAFLEVEVPGLDLSSVNAVGGQYFTTTQGVLYTVSNDGFVYSKREMGAFKGAQLARGGNYFFYNKSLYTVTQSGVVMSAGMAQDFGKVSVLGTNFFITTANKLFTVSTSGTVRNMEIEFKASDISNFSHL